MNDNKNMDKYTNYDKIINQVKESLSMSTVKGIPRIMKTKNKCIRSLWIMATILVLFFACGHSYLLFKGFLQYGVYTITEESFDLTFSVDYFPSVTICSLIPFAENTKESIPTYRTFHESVEKRLNDLKNENLSLSEGEESLLKNINMYFDWLTLEKAKLKGYDSDIFVLKCKLMLSGNKAARAPCKNFLKITLVQNPDLFNCFTLKFSLPRSSGKFIEKVMLSLFLGNIPSDYAYYIEKNKELTGQGVKIFIHDRQENYPRVHGHGLIVSKGVKGILTTRPNLRIRKAAPYTNCQKTKNYMYNFAGDFVDSKSFSYCTLKQWQDFIVKSINCTLSSLLIISDRKHLNLPKCRQLSKYITKEELLTIAYTNRFLLGWNRLASPTSTPSSNNNNDINNDNTAKDQSTQRKCHESCEELRFKYTFSSLALDERFLINLYEYADNKKAMKSYLESSNDFKKCLTNFQNYTECFERVSTASYKDLIQLDIQQDSQSGGIIEFDVPQFELADFLAKLAATVNFWVGVSAIFCIELFDILLQVILSIEFPKY
ncbi:DgyrCDS2622 [Dimorphilus gyrociliatus]|uniref:DgyrCDS2622 n=1 Tax=Dimorphilus gyrociliatus TaxID=2664684 RepID=A0A7I8VB97_9ANNE|nr:DgyrCDS2622 [Dimorphilus gyrociliatus]